MLCLLGWRPSVAQGVTPVGNQVRTALYTIIRKSKVKWSKGSKKRHNGALRHTASVRWIAGEAICTSEGEHERGNTTVSQSFFRGARKENCRCPKSWARRLIWTKTKAR